MDQIRAATITKGCKLRSQEVYGNGHVQHGRVPCMGLGYVKNLRVGNSIRHCTQAFAVVAGAPCRWLGGRNRHCSVGGWDIPAKGWGVEQQYGTQTHRKWTDADRLGIEKIEKDGRQSVSIGPVHEAGKSMS